MTSFFGNGPLYVAGWMDSGPLAYFSVAPKPLVLAALAVPLTVGLWTRSRGLALFGGAVLLGSLFLMGLFLPLGFWGGLALAGYLVGAVVLGRRSGREVLAPFVVGGIVFALALGLGFPGSLVFNPVVCRSNLKNIGTALELWATDHEGERPASLQELTPNYLRDLPDCHGVSYAYAAPVVSCQNPFHQQLEGTPPGYPRLDDEGELKTAP
ncbi:MAG: hypothetical protein AB7S38_12800 [Vulcanimicrobiota bacterium]